ncbi:hypothetical protein PENSOL_c009G01438 [Penicillium solitum]|uniref:Nephrocystin 3-like N-terminal domain-containing protein n=1 Tax=Penicillium solitum TaxID=60172 RepID=A0A1V6R9X2_9EURO|nr:uncharacterized protein PENSOL_c009G01438 [Penicillium solitum]OQD98394.1 hypothetical protein PENSOL_c009G01438 [Penicillium solitum]
MSSLLRCGIWRRNRDGNGPRQPEGSLAIKGSGAGRSTVHSQVTAETKVLTAPGDAEAPSAPSSQRSPKSGSQVQVPHESTNDQASKQSSQVKPYADTYDLWTEALESLKEEERRDVEALLGDLDRDDTDRKGLVDDIQKKLDVASKSEHHDRTTSIDKFLSVLNKFLSVGDVVVSFDPVHAALPWAAVRSVIVILTADRELKGFILTGMTEVASLLVRCDMYQQLYMAPDPALRPPEDALGKLNASIVQTYAGLQSFLVFIVRRQRSKVKIDAVFKLENARSHMDKLSGSEKQLLQAADDCGKAYFVLERISSKDERELLEWISPIQYGKHHTISAESRTHGTCEWLLQDEEFSEWRDYQSSAVLWLQGSMGAGKTYLTSKVIDYIQGLLKSSSPDTGFAYFYCNRNEEERRDPLSILQSCVRQLSTAVGSTGHIRKSLQVVSDEARRQGSHFGLEAYKTQLLESVNGYSQTSIIIDALDECYEHSRWQLIDVIRELVSKSDRPLKVFISSRPDEYIKTQFSGKSIEIHAINNQDDIEKFVNAEIEKPRHCGPISQSLRSDIVRTLRQGVLELPTERDIRDRLRRLPIDLKEAYDEIYGKIAEFQHAKVLVDRACKWVMSACTPPSSDGLLSAICIDPNENSVNFENKVTKSSLLSLCNNLLVFDSQRKVWRFSHLSVVEYFEVNHWSLRQAHCNAAKVCLKFMIETYGNPTYEGNIKSSGDKHNMKKLGPVHPFEIYVRHHWVIHVATYEDLIAKEGQEVDSLLAKLLKTFLGSPSESSFQYRAWYRRLGSALRSPPSSFLRERGKFQFGHTEEADISPEEVTICAMCRFPFYILLQDCDTLLVLAIKAGCKAICETLINRGIEINLVLPENRYGSALAAAACGGRVEIFNLLIENGADASLTLLVRGYGSALAAAASQGNKETVNLLIYNGADVNLLLLNGNFGSALAATAWEGDKDIVNLLIDNGADVNLLLLSGNFGSALAAAASQGYKEIVNLLVKNGADANLTLSSGEYGSALAAAAHSGEKEIVNLLIENGADVNLTLSSGDYGSALAAAVSNRENEIVNLLIENGADVNLTSGHFGGALAAAACRGYETIVNILIENGADVNLTSGGHGSTLAAAACRGYETIVNILIENGADVNLTDGGYGSALAAAACRGYEKIVNILIENGADVNLTSGGYGSALVAAAFNGEKEIVNLLIENGADVNLTSGGYGSALVAAVSNGENEIVTSSSRMGPTRTSRV